MYNYTAVHTLIMFSPSPSSRKRSSAVRRPPAAAASPRPQTPSSASPLGARTRAAPCRIDTALSPRAPLTPQRGEALSNRSVSTKISDRPKLFSPGAGRQPAPVPSEPPIVMDDHMRIEILKTTLMQTQYTRERLREAAEREKEKAELDLLRLWQLVLEAEEEEAALADKHGAMTEVVRTHCALNTMSETLQRLVQTMLPVAPFLEEHAARVKERQRDIPLKSTARCDESKLIVQIEAIRRLVQNTEMKLQSQIQFPKALHASAAIYNNVSHIAALISKSELSISEATKEIPSLREAAHDTNADTLEEFLLRLSRSSESLIVPELSF